jgi:phage FluMu protein Com
MRNVPSWVVDALMSKKFTCQGCRKVLDKIETLKAMGIRECFKDPTRESFFIELCCPKCKTITFFELQEMTLVDLSFEILDEIEDEEEDDERESRGKNNKKEQRLWDSEDEEDEDGDYDDDYEEENKDKKRDKNEDGIKEGSKITKKEIEDSAKVLKTLKTHDDFLEMIGLSPEKIKEYQIFKKEKKKNEK